ESLPGPSCGGRPGRDADLPRVARRHGGARTAPPPFRAGGPAPCGDRDRPADPSHAAAAAHAVWNRVACEITSPLSPSGASIPQVEARVHRAPPRSYAYSVPCPVGKSRQAIVLMTLAIQTEGAAGGTPVARCELWPPVEYWCGDAKRRGVAPSPYMRLYLGPLPPSRGVHRGLPTREPSPGERHQRRLYPTRIESVLEGEPHIPGAIQVLHDEGRVHQPVVLGEPCAGRVARREPRMDGARGEHSRLHRVVDSLEGR